MTAKEYTNSIQGLINDFVNGASDEREFKVGLLDVLIDARAGFLNRANQIIDEMVKDVKEKEAKNDGLLEYLQLGHQGRLDALLELKTKLSPNSSPDQPETGQGSKVTV